MSLADMVRRVQLFLLYPHVDVTNLGDMLNAAALQAHTAANPPNPYQTVKRYLAALEPPSPGDAPVFSSPGTSTSSKHSRIMQMKGKNGSLPSDPVKHVKESRNVEQPASPLLVSRVQKQTAALSASPEGKSNIKKTAKDEHSRKRKHQSIGQDEAKGVQCASFHINALLELLNVKGAQVYRLKIQLAIPHRRAEKTQKLKDVSSCLASCEQVQTVLRSAEHEP